MTFEKTRKNFIIALTLHYTPEKSFGSYFRNIKMTVYLRKKYTKIRAMPKAHEIKPDKVVWKAKLIKPGSKGKLCVQVVENNESQFRKPVHRSVKIAFQAHTTVIKGLGASLMHREQVLEARRKAFWEYVILGN